MTSDERAWRGFMVMLATIAVILSLFYNQEIYSFIDWVLTNG